MDAITKGFLGGNTEIAIPYYEKFLEEKGIRSRDTRGYKHFHPSAFGGCLRKMAYQYHGENDSRFVIKEPIDVKFMRICDTGHAFHDRMQRDMAIMGILRGLWRCRACGNVFGKENPLGTFLPDICECIKDNPKDKRRGIKLFEYEEIFLQSEPEYNFKGNCDGIIELEKGDPETRYVIDFKSISSGSFAYLKKPDPKYVVQITIYMWLTGVHKSVIYYEEKDKHTLKEFIIPYDEGLVDHIKKSSKMLFKICSAGKIPAVPKGYKKSNKPCTSFGKKCEYFKLCHG